MGLALDEPTDKDKLYKETGFDVVIETGLLSQVGGIVIHYGSNGWSGSGFHISPTYKGASSCC